MFVVLISFLPLLQVLNNFLLMGIFTSKLFWNIIPFLLIWPFNDGVKRYNHRTAFQPNFFSAALFNEVAKKVIGKQLPIRAVVGEQSQALSQIQLERMP